MGKFYVLVLCLVICYCSAIEVSSHHIEVRRETMMLSDVPTNPDPLRIAYFMNITVGTSPLQVLIDTGSGNLAVDSVHCIGCVGSSGYQAGSTATVYTCQNAQDCSCTEQCSCSHNTQSYDNSVCEFGVNYVDGSGWQAVKVNDYVTLANYYSAWNTFGSIQSETGMSTYYPNNDGTIGFAYGDSLSVTGNCWFEDYVEQSGSDAIFSVCMGLRKGWLTIGEIDEKLANGNIYYTPFAETGFYSVNLETIDVISYTNTTQMQKDTIQVYRSPTDNIGPILDTGSSGLYLDPSTFNAVTSKIINQCYSSGGNWTGICDSSSHSNNNWLKGCIRVSLEELFYYPQLIFNFSGGASVTVSSFHYMVPFGDYTITEDLYCLGILQGPSGSNINLGDPFLRSSYTIFDLENQRIGFAPPNPLYCP